jgi:DNA polymerase III alpha subunit
MIEHVFEHSRMSPWLLSSPESELAGSLRPDPESGPPVRACLPPMTGVFAVSRPIPLRRERLDALGAVPAELLSTVHHGRRIVVSGIVAGRQCITCASPAAWLDLEDETGRVHVVCMDDVLARHRRDLETAAALAVLGTLHKNGNRLDVVAERVIRVFVSDEPSQAQ